MSSTDQPETALGYVPPPCESCGAPSQIAAFIFIKYDNELGHICHGPGRFFCIAHKPFLHSISMEQYYTGLVTRLESDNLQSGDED